MAYVIVTKLAVAKPQRNKQRKAAELRCCTGIWPLAFFLVPPPQTPVADVGRYPLRTWAPAILSECPLGSPQASISDPLWPRLSQKPLLARL